MIQQLSLVLCFEISCPVSNGAIVEVYVRGPRTVHEFDTSGLSPIEMVGHREVLLTGRGKFRLSLCILYRRIADKWWQVSTNICITCFRSDTLFCLFPIKVFHRRLGLYPRVQESKLPKSQMREWLEMISSKVALKGILGGFAVLRKNNNLSQFTFASHCWRTYLGGGCDAKS